MQAPSSCVLRMQDRDSQWLSHPELDKPKVLFMNSHFVTKLCQEGEGFEYSRVQRWTGARKLRRIGITHYQGIRDVDKVVVPVHLGNHWVRSRRVILMLPPDPAASRGKRPIREQSSHGASACRARTWTFSHDRTER